MITDDSDEVMITDLTELLIRLRLQLELLDYERGDGPPHPFGFASLAAVDLIEEIQRSLMRGDADRIKLAAVVKAWEQRSLDGRPAPKAVGS
jgi:hypothetical protein